MLKITHFIILVVALSAHYLCQHYVSTNFFENAKQMFFVAESLYGAGAGAGQGFSINNPFVSTNRPKLREGITSLKEDYDLHREPFNEYDFVIVGAGSSGSVIANRLTEVPEWKVLLIEAGFGEMFFTEVPILSAYFQKTDYNWGHRMEPQPGVCLGMEDQRCNWPRGKAVGGTSVINYMIYTRGNRVDYDRWAAAGNPGWSYDEVLPYFTKSERANLAYHDSGYHGYDGYLSVEDVPFRSRVVGPFIQGAQQIGHRFTDYNGRDQFGFGYVQANTLRGRRHSTAKAFLRPIKKRPNLHILTNARATKLIIDNKSRRAIGVEYYKDGRKRSVRARKEVIVSAGTYHSPQLLMLSGIGPRQHLQEMGIPVIQDLPVGETMYDHICYPGLAFTVNITDATLIFTKDLRISNLLGWFNGQGPYTQIGGVEALGYIQTNRSTENIQHADIELIFLGGALTSDFGTGVRRGMDITDEVYNTVFRPLENREVWTAFPMLVHPNSKGFLRLKDKNPFNWPRLYGNYFTDPGNQDIDTMVEGIKEIIKISESPAMQNIGSTLNTIPLPGCRHIRFGSDEYWRCALRQLTATLHHQVATCKMGPRDDPEAIVDPELRVYGIRGLRVADCSIIPIPLTAHTNAPAIMVGEKAADLIKRDWLQRFK